jgi:hypothetical protein
MSTSSIVADIFDERVTEAFHGERELYSADVQRAGT